MARDAVLADPYVGPVSPCGWADYAQADVDGDPTRRVAVCAMPGTDFNELRNSRGPQDIIRACELA